MSPRRTAAGLLTVGVIAGAIMLTSGPEPRTVTFEMTNASGLKNGSGVRIGGKDSGRVELALGKDDRAVVKVELTEDAPAIGRDSTVAVQAVNFLGTKRVVVDPGSGARDLAPDGFRIPADRVTTPTDLDQVLGVFDANTRTRAMVLFNELGSAVVGRRADIRRLLQEFPVGLEQAGAVVAELAEDRETLRGLVARSDRFVAEATTRRREVRRMVDRLGEAATTVSARRAELRSTLENAPRTLTALQGFLGDLRATTTDLGPAAQQLQRVAAPLSQTLAQVEGFRRAAVPTLDEATAVAPSLSRLASRVTPVLRRARPTLQGLSGAARATPPVAKALDGSADNIIAVLENWSRAIQFRDELGHVFRGEASISPDLILSAVERLTSKPAQRKRPARPANQKPLLKLPDAVPAPVKEAVEKLPAAKVPAIEQLLDGLPKIPSAEDIKQLVGEVQQLIAPKQAPNPPAPVGGLLDFFLGD